VDYAIHLFTLIAIFAMVGSSLNLVWGYTGLLSLASAAFFGVGAYSVAIGTRFGAEYFVVSALLGVAISCVLSLAVGFPSLRIRDDYFVIATFALQVVFAGVLNNWTWLTSGPQGIPGIPRPRLIGFALASDRSFAILVATCLVATLWLERRLVTAPLGRVLRGIRQDEVLVTACGRNVAAYKVLAVLLGAGLAAAAGALFAAYIGFVDPTSFTVMDSVFVVSIVIAGGSGALGGPPLGAVLLVGVPELLRWLGLPVGVAANLRQMLFGLALVAVVAIRPQGLVGRFAMRSGR